MIFSRSPLLLFVTWQVATDNIMLSLSSLIQYLTISCLQADCKWLPSHIVLPNSMSTNIWVDSRLQDWNYLCIEMPKRILYQIYHATFALLTSHADIAFESFDAFAGCQHHLYSKTESFWLLPIASVIPADQKESEIVYFRAFGDGFCLTSLIPSWFILSLEIWMT